VTKHLLCDHKGQKGPGAKGLPVRWQGVRDPLGLLRVHQAQLRGDEAGMLGVLYFYILIINNCNDEVLLPWAKSSLKAVKS